jgi:hypothetical protein
LLNFFLFYQNVVGKTNTPKPRKKNGIFMEFFEELSGGFAANDQQPKDGNRTQFTE